MKLNKSPKIFENYKCDYPENTIKKIESGLQQLGLNHRYKEKMIESAGFSTYSGDLILEDFGFSTTGKSFSPILAKASAYAEMVERISAGFTIFYNLNSNLEKNTELIGDIIQRKFLRGYVKDTSYKNADFDEICNYFQTSFSKKQYDFLKENNVFDVLIDSYSFIENKYSKVPVHFIDMISGSNGLAAGNTLEEAIVQGSCEIFERYAASEIVSKKIVCPTVDASSIDDDRVQSFVRMLDSLNFEVLIKDFTLGNKVPVIGVLFINHNIEDDDNALKKERYFKLIDAGSHPNISEAVVRCFIERLQELTKDELMYRKQSDVIYDFWTKIVKKQYLKNKDAFKHFFRDYYYYGNLSFLEKGEVISFDKIRSIRNTDCYDDVKYIVDICKQNNWDFKVVDNTHKKIGFPAVRMIIPPISSDSNPYIHSFLSYDDYKEQFNYYYGIKNFFDFYDSDDWFEDDDKINLLIQNIEDMVSGDLFSYEFYMRRGPFYQIINVFHVLAFSYISIGGFDESLKYFNFLHDLQNNKDYGSKFFETLYNPGFAPGLYSKYIELIKTKSIKEKGFRFNSNPFHPKEESEKSDEKKIELIKRFRDSYF